MKGLNKLAFYVYEDLPVVDILIADEKHSFILDSGATAHFMDNALTSSLSITMAPTGNAKNIVTAAGNAKQSNEYLILNCKLGSSDLQSLKAFEKDFSSISETLGKKISGLLSISKLCTDKVYFDLKSNNIFFN